MTKGKPKLISLRQAAAAGIARVRKPKWADPCDHIKIDIVTGRLGPWVHFYAPSNKRFNGRDPVDILIVGGGIAQLHIDPNSVEFVAHDGPDNSSTVYAAAVADWEPTASETGNA